MWGLEISSKNFIFQEKEANDSDETKLGDLQHKHLETRSKIAERVASGEGGRMRARTLYAGTGGRSSS